jgi:superfamily II DNA or RNA helicase
MIGDVVGLGKTITATAVAKIMEDDLYYNTLVVCPKNLVTMWEGYVHKYRLYAKVISHSMIARELPELRRYKLVVIDESHNFRNNLGAGYRALRAYISENDSKVILLSATPYNKTYLDLANQLKLFIGDDDDIGIRPERYIAALGGLVEFNYKHTDTPVKSIAAFEKSEFADDWRDVMRLYLVRRTRSFIKVNYAKDDAVSGRKYLEFANGEKSYFPDRKPKTVEFSLSAEDPNDQYALLYDDDTVSTINALNLPRYGLIQYEATKPSVAATADELRIMQNLSRAGKQVLGFCRTNLYKRLESSGYAFCLSISRHILRNHIFIYALENSLKLPVSSSVVVDMYTDGDEDDIQLNLDYSWNDADYAKAAERFYHIFDQDMHKRFDWIRSELFDSKTLIDQLQADSENLLAILHKIKVWHVFADRKLAKLRDLIEKTHKRDKVIVFTQFADTAEYLYEQLTESGVKNMALALGGSDDIVSLVKRFSPTSNQVEHFDKKTELRVLITTDVLSEGQNLQDAHIIVNFDLPWAIVRLIQRAGRVDRIGQRALEILCYSFLPEDGIEKIIGLRSKLSTRIKQNAEVVGSDEMFFDGDPVNISDLYSEKSGILDEEEDTEVDLASYAYQIWKNAIDANPELQATIESMPNVVFSAKETSPDQSGSGVVVYVKSNSDNDALAWLNENGEIASQSQYAILKTAECVYDTSAHEKLPKHHELVKSCVEQIQAETDTVTGTLGRKNSVKYRVYRQLERFREENLGTLFVPPKLDNALDEIFQNPLKESAIDALSRQMKSGISDEKLAELVVSLYTDRRLCNVADEDNIYHVPQIICSMGLIGGDAR